MGGGYFGYRLCLCDDRIELLPIQSRALNSLAKRSQRFEIIHPNTFRNKGFSLLFLPSTSFFRIPGNKMPGPKFNLEHAKKNDKFCHSLSNSTSGLTYRLSWNGRRQSAHHFLIA